MLFCCMAVRFDKKKNWTNKLLDFSLYKEFTTRENLRLCSVISLTHATSKAMVL